MSSRSKKAVFGQNLVEYLVLIGLVACALFAACVRFGGTVHDSYTTGHTALLRATDPSDPAGYPSSPGNPYVWLPATQRWIDPGNSGLFVSFAEVARYESDPYVYAR